MDASEGLRPPVGRVHARRRTAEPQPRWRSPSSCSQAEGGLPQRSEVQMKRIQVQRAGLAAATAAALVLAGIAGAPAADSALTGQVSSAEEGAMEGVLVSAQ